MATTMLCPSWSVLRLQSNIITNEQTTQLAKRPIWPRPPERLGALVSAFLSAAPLLTRSNIHRRDSLPAVSCNAGFCNAPEARCLTSTMLMALQKPHRSANNGVPRGVSPNGSIQNDAAILCDYNGLDCLTVTNGTTGAQRFFPALSHRASSKLALPTTSALDSAPG